MIIRGRGVVGWSCIGRWRRAQIVRLRLSFFLVSPALTVCALSIVQVRVILGVCIKVATLNCSADELPKYALKSIEINIAYAFRSGALTPTHEVATTLKSITNSVNWPHCTKHLNTSSSHFTLRGASTYLKAQRVILSRLERPPLLLLPSPVGLHALLVVQSLVVRMG